MDSLPAPRPLLVEDACSEDEENCAEAYQTLLEAAQRAVQAGAKDALQLVRDALVNTRAVIVTLRDGTEVSVHPTHSGFYLTWPRTMSPIDAPKPKKGAPRSRRGAHFKTVKKVRHIKLTVTQELADEVSQGLFKALLARGPRSAHRSEAALSLTTLALQPVFAQLLREVLDAPSPPVALHTDDVSTITDGLRSAMHTDFAAFAGLLLPLAAGHGSAFSAHTTCTHPAHLQACVCRRGRVQIDADPRHHCGRHNRRPCQEEHAASTPC